MSMVLATSWVRRGVAAQFPIKYEIDEVEIGRISKLAQLQLEDAQEELEKAQKGDKDTEDEDVKVEEAASAPVPKGSTIECVFFHAK